MPGFSRHCSRLSKIQNKRLLINYKIQLWLNLKEKQGEGVGWFEKQSDENRKLKFTPKNIHARASGFLIQENKWKPIHEFRVVVASKRVTTWRRVSHASYLPLSPPPCPSSSWSMTSLPPDWWRREPTPDAPAPSCSNLSPPLELQGMTSYGLLCFKVCWSG